MRKTIFTLALTSFVFLTGCTENNGNEQIRDTNDHINDTTVQNYNAKEIVTSENFTLELENKRISRAHVDSVNLLILESFPLQVRAIVAGYLNDGCTGMHEIIQERENNTFYIALLTERDTEQMCTQALVPYEENISIDVYGLEAGTYSVNVNGLTTEFTFDTDNIAK